jgi:nitrogen fixation NifU-like protein
MDNVFDEFAQNLQERIYSEVKEIYGIKALEQWKSPKYTGIMENPDGCARLTGRCGDTMEIYLRFRDNRVEEALYLTDGCGSSNICGSFAAELAHGKTPDELTEVTGESIINAIGGLPEEETHCAFLAAETLQEALNNYMIRQRMNKR